MIGRIDKNHADSNYIYVIGSDRLSTDLHKINEAANREFTNIDLDYTYNAKNDPNRFYYRQRPITTLPKKASPPFSIFLALMPITTAPPIRWIRSCSIKWENITKLVFYTTWELANREERIRVDVKEGLKN